MPTEVPSSLVGQVLDGRYRVLSHIADGGMASVYVALDQRLDREVALKVMRPSLAHDETFVSRFRREARSAARLSHPNVVAVYDQGEDAGHMFLAMELVTGQTLRQVMQAEGPLTPRAALDILDPVLQALAAAHAAGLIHRDVKPENVILREDGTVKVADFGLARAVTSATVTSQTDMLIGTVAYLSPEQVERGIADARSDVYAAGLLLFEMLTGTKAFSGDSPIHVAYQHVHGTVPIPSHRVASVPRALDALVARATARDPDERPRDAGQLLAELRQARASLSATELDDRPGLATPGDTTSSTLALPRPAFARTGQGAGGAATGRQDAGRRRRSGWLVAAITVLVLAGLGLWFFLAGPGAQVTVPRLAGQTRQVAVAALQRAHLGAHVTTAFDETVRPGVVITSDPTAGTDVRRGSTVDLTVSKGPERYAVPGLVGRTQAEAEQRLSEAHLAMGSVTQAWSEKVPEGQVVSTRPAKGASVKPHTAVDLVVSKGPQPITVQDWTGKPAADAQRALTGAGLKVDASGQAFSTSVPKGSVISQDPTAGTLHRGDTVTLVVSKGPQLVKVPDVVGKQEGDAARILKAAGFTVTVERAFGGFFNTVRFQSPDAGQLAPKGSTITLTVV